MGAVIQAKDLTRIIWNALLFLDKNSPTGPAAEFSIINEKLLVRSSDAYSGLIERWWLDKPPAPGRQQWYCSKEYLQDLSKKLKVEPEATIDLMDLEGVSVSDEQAKAWKDFHYLSRYIRPLGEANGFAFSHDRLKLLYRVRPGGDYPIIFRMSELPLEDLHTEPIVEYRIGPDIRGYVAPLDGVAINTDWQVT